MEGEGTVPRAGNDPGLLPENGRLFDLWNFPVVAGASRTFLLLSGADPVSSPTADDGFSASLPTGEGFPPLDTGGLLPPEAEGFPPLDRGLLLLVGGLDLDLSAEAVVGDAVCGFLLGAAELGLEVEGADLAAAAVDAEGLVLTRALGAGRVGGAVAEVFWKTATKKPSVPSSVASAVDGKLGGAKVRTWGRSQHLW